MVHGRAVWFTVASGPGNSKGTASTSRGRDADGKIRKDEVLKSSSFVGLIPDRVREVYSTRKLLEG